jgi:hypothetical protein
LRRAAWIPSVAAVAERGESAEGIEPLRGRRSVLAAAWVAFVVALHLAVRVFGLWVVP